MLALLVGVLVLVSRPPGDSLPGAAAVAPPAPARRPEHGSLLHAVLEAHGGVDRWRAIERIRVRLRFGGLAFRMRFVEPEPVDRWLELEVDNPRGVLSDYPEPGQRGIFTAERVWIESASGETLRSLDDPREVLLASRRRQLWWDDLDLLYFAGYATWNYFQGPFLLLRPGVEAREVEPWSENGETWRRLAVRFHGSVPTHSPEQVFYYGEDLRQRRHDYAPNVFAAWATAAHYTADYRAFAGVWMPTRRIVVPRGRTPGEGPTLVWIEVREVEFLPARAPVRD